MIIAQILNDQGRKLAASLIIRGFIVALFCLSANLALDTSTTGFEFSQHGGQAGTAISFLIPLGVLLVLFGNSVVGACVAAYWLATRSLETRCKLDAIFSFALMWLFYGLGALGAVAIAFTVFDPSIRQQVSGVSQPLTEVGGAIYFLANIAFFVSAAFVVSGLSLLGFLERKRLGRNPNLK